MTLKHRSVYFIPSLLPKFNKWEDYLHELAGAVLSIYKKFSIELPEWVERVRLNGEVALRAEIDKCEEGIRLAKSKLMEYSNFKLILIANTFIGGARSEEEKDKAPEEEQVSLAERHKVLILRTLDLLRMYNAVSSGRYTREKVVELLLTKVGWWSFEKEDAPNSGVGAVVGP